MKLQKRLAARVLKCSPRRITFDPDKLAEIKEAITKHDIRALISKGVIVKQPARGTGKFHSRKAKAQKHKGRRKGHGSRKGTLGARSDAKATWIATIRAQRSLLKRLHQNDKISTSDYHALYAKAKGGFFRSTRHIKLYAKEHGIFKGQ